jgi:predicted lipoprotein
MNKNLNAIVLLLIFVSSCKEKKADFDRGPLLENIGKNIILPSYQDANQKALALKAAANDFKASPDVTKRQVLKAAFRDAHLAWQTVEVYDFAKGASQAASLNTFPADSSVINANILSGSYDLQTAANLSAKGFAALDFLLYSKNEANTVAFFSASANAKTYLQDIVNDISTNISATYSDWNSSYTNTFTSSKGLDLGGSVSILCNSWSQMTERSRRERVGNSLGYVGFISSGVIAPQLLEGFYAANSKELLIANLQAGKNLFLGGSGTGFDDYPQVQQASYQGVPLSDEISAQFDRCIAAAQAVSGDFATALANNKSKMETLFLELKKLSVLIKVDMASAIGVTINYTDNDGD